MGRRRPERSQRRAVVGLTVAVSAGVWAGCTSAAAPAAAPAVPVGANGTVDAELARGRSVFIDHCARCHGKAGEGGAGPKLRDGKVLADFPDPAQQIDLVRNGRRGMPSWDGKIGDGDIEAVVRYTREVLTVT